MDNHQTFSVWEVAMAIGLSESVTRTRINRAVREGLIPEGLTRLTYEQVKIILRQKRALREVTTNRAAAEALRKQLKIDGFSLRGGL